MSDRYEGPRAHAEKWWDGAIDEEPVEHSFGERKIKKLVQVPVTHEVRVPTKTERVVPTTEIAEIPIRLHRQEQAFKSVEEEYIDYEEKEVTRMKERWVRTEVPETFMERVPVKKTRMVEVPYTVTKEYTEIQRVEVPSSKLVDVPGYRIDEVVELETHEVEGIQRIEWVPRVVDELAEERDIGVREKIVVDRRIGKEIYASDDPQLARLPRVDTEHAKEVAGGRLVYDHHHEGFTPVEDHGLKSSVVNRRSVHTAPHPQVSVRPSRYAPAGGDSHFGIHVRESVIGLVVRDVVPGSAGAEAGIAPGDIINKVDDLEVYSTEEWRRAIGRKTAALVSYRSKQQGKNFKQLLSH